MAGKRSPWGKTPGDKGDNEQTPEEEGGTPPSAEETPRGPRNPWLPGGGAEDRPRRSANIEDIFKHRGPEGPRRGGGTGGPGFRLPQRPGGGSWFPIAIGGIALVWLGVTSMHFVQPREQAVVTTLGK